MKVKITETDGRVNLPPVRITDQFRERFKRKLPHWLEKGTARMLRTKISLDETIAFSGIFKKQRSAKRSTFRSAPSRRFDRASAEQRLKIRPHPPIPQRG